MPAYVDVLPLASYVLHQWHVPAVYCNYYSKYLWNQSSYLCMRELRQTSVISSHLHQNYMTLYVAIVMATLLYIYTTETLNILLNILIGY